MTDEPSETSQKDRETAKTTAGDDSSPTSNPPSINTQRKNTKNNSMRNSLKMTAPIVGEVSLGSSWERRWQSIAMFSCSLYFIVPCIFGMWSLVGYGLFGGHGQTWLTFLVAFYLGFMMVLDKGPLTGSRPPLLRNFRWWWDHSCDYLPLLLVKTADLPADGAKYILGYHPHGIISVGCFGAFATDGSRTLDISDVRSKESKANSQRTTAIKKEDDEPSAEAADAQPDVMVGRGFSSLFPGLDRRVITLPQNFNTPFLREYFLCMGACTSAKETFRNILARENTAVVVVVGGAAESLESTEGGIHLVLEKRRGFVREAILAQASLVPVLAFGETDLYHVFDTQDRHLLKSLQTIVKHLTGFGMPIFQGRSIFFKDVGIMPQRKPVVVVVGSPIPPPTLENPKSFAPQIDRKTDTALNDDGKLLMKYHAQYIQALEGLYAEHKNASWNAPGRIRRSSLSIK